MKFACLIIVALSGLVMAHFYVGHAYAQGLDALANEPIFESGATRVAPQEALARVKAPPVAVSDVALAYVLGVNDSIKVSVYGESDLSGTYTVDASGAISMPLIGAVNVAGQDLRQVETILKAKFSDGYLVGPDVSIAVMTYRPFFILGEVRSPGSYNYTNGATVLKAVAVAGGFTYRANKKEVQVLRTKKNGSELYENVPVNKAIGPGDIILVKERFF